VDSPCHVPNGTTKVAFLPGGTVTDSVLHPRWPSAPGLLRLNSTRSGTSCGLRTSMATASNSLRSHFPLRGSNSTPGHDAPASVATWSACPPSSGTRRASACWGLILTAVGSLKSTITRGAGGLPPPRAVGCHPVNTPIAIAHIAINKSQCCLVILGRRCRFIVFSTFWMSAKRSHCNLSPVRFRAVEADWLDLAAAALSEPVPGDGRRAPRTPAER
jgi:hypothetical protein